MTNNLVDPTGRPLIVQTIKITEIDKELLKENKENTGQGYSEYIRHLIRLDSRNSDKLRLDEIKNKIRDHTFEIKKLEYEQKEIEAIKTAADNREQVIIKEIKELLPSLEANHGKINKINHFIYGRVTNINDNFNGNNTKPLTVNEFTEKLIEYAKTQGVKCRV